MIETRALQLVLIEAKPGEKVVMTENSWNKRALEPEDIVIQNYLVPTVNTTLIKCRYFLEVEFSHSGMVSSDIPKVIFPIYMMAPEINEDLHKLEIPVNYDPLIFHIVDVKIPFQQ